MEKIRDQAGGFRISNPVRFFKDVMLEKVTNLVIKIGFFFKYDEFSIVLLKLLATPLFSSTQKIRVARRLYILGYVDRYREIIRDALNVCLASDIESREDFPVQIRFFFPQEFSSFGHMAILDIFIKAHKLGLIHGINCLVGKPSEFANKALYQVLAKNFTLLRDSSLFRRIDSEMPRSLMRVDYMEMSSGQLLFLDEFSSCVQKLWEVENQPPNVRLDPADRVRGYSMLRQLKVPSHSWVACFHVRDEGGLSSSVRNSSVLSYLNAVRLVNDLGGYVFLLGNGEHQVRAMMEVDPSLKIISSKSIDPFPDWFDLFLIAECRFFLGCGSGPASVAQCFGKLVGGANWGPLRSRAWGKNVVLLPKKYRFKDGGRDLSLEMRMSDEFGYTEDLKVLSRLGVSIHENTSFELELFVKELFELSDKLTSFRDDNTQKKFDTLSTKHRLYPVKLSRVFDGQ